MNLVTTCGNFISIFLRGLKNYRLSSTLRLSKRKAVWVAGSTALLLAPVAYAIDNTQPEAQPVTPQPTAQVNLETTPTSQPDSSADDSSTDSSSSSSTTNPSADVTNQTSTTVSVNGQNVPVPDNGSVNQTITSNGQHTSISITSNHSSSGGNNNNVSNNTSIHQSTSSNIINKTIEDTQ